VQHDTFFWLCQYPSDAKDFGFDSSDCEQWRVQLCRCFGWHTASSVPLFFGRVKPLLIVVTKSSGAGFSAAPDGTGFPTVGKSARFMHHASPE